MTATILIDRASPGMSLQDMGRFGLVSQGISLGGAADRLALLEAAALLNTPAAPAAVEMAGAGGVFRTDTTCRIALTGAPMRASVDGTPLTWSAAHVLYAGQTLTIGGAIEGTYGYLSFGGMVAQDPWHGSLSTHFTAGIGTALKAGDSLRLDMDPSPEAPALKIATSDRFAGGTVRVMPGPQSALFDDATRARFFATTFRRGARANRQGTQLVHDGAPFGSEKASGLASDFIVPGDIQMTGDGQPYVLMNECQTIGGYPRMGTVLPQDLPVLAQCPAGQPIRFVELTVEDADELFETETAQLRQLQSLTEPLIRDPHSIRDLLSYQLISGVTAGYDVDTPYGRPNGREK